MCSPVKDDSKYFGTRICVSSWCSWLPGIQKESLTWSALRWTALVWLNALLRMAKQSNGEAQMLGQDHMPPCWCAGSKTLRQLKQRCLSQKILQIVAFSFSNSVNFLVKALMSISIRVVVRGTWEPNWIWGLTTWFLGLTLEQGLNNKPPLASKAQQTSDAIAGLWAKSPALFQSCRELQT